MKLDRSRLNAKSLLMISVGALSSTSGLAAEWTNSVAVAPGVTYTDNVCLSNNNKQDAWVGLVTPSGSISSIGNKANFNVRGSVQFNTLSNSDLKDDNCAGGSFGDREQFAPDIDARGSVILIDDWLTLTANGRADQNEVNPSRGGGGDSLDGNGNTNTYYRYGVSPVLSRRLKDVATFTLRYNYNEVINSQDAVSDSSSDSWASNLEGGESSRVSWNWMSNYREVQYSDNDLIVVDGVVQPREDTVLKSTALQLGYQIDRQWQVNGLYGWEWNDYQTYNDDKPEGQTWDVGVRWTPTMRTTVGVGFGDRFFGETPRFNISHQRKRSLFTASYNKTITFGRDILTEEGGLDTNFNTGSALNTQSPIIDERFTLGYTYTGRRATLSLYGSHSDQTEEDNGEKSTFESLALTYSPLVPRPYSLSGTVAWNSNEPRDQFGNPNNAQFEDNSETWTTGVTLGRTLNDRMNLSLNYRYTDQQSDVSFNEYQENRVMATLNIRL